MKRSQEERQVSSFPRPVPAAFVLGLADGGTVHVIVDIVGYFE
jgi:hypothetical protein